MSIQFHEKLDTRKKIHEAVRIAHGFTSRGFQVELVLDTTERIHTITPAQGFKPLVLKYLLGEFIRINGPIMCLVQILEDD